MAESMWTRTPVIDEFPSVLCVRINRFIVDPQTFAIQKNTVSLHLCVLCVECCGNR